MINGDGSGSFAAHGGPGDRFVASKGTQQIKDPGSRPQSFSSGLIEVSSVPLERKGRLLERVGGPGGGLVPPAYQPGVVSKLSEPLGVADVFG